MMGIMHHCSDSIPVYRLRELLFASGMVCVADSSDAPSPNSLQWHKLLGEHCDQAMRLCGKCKLAAHLSQKWFSVISDFGGAEEKLWSWSNRLGLGRQFIPCSAVSEPVGQLPLSKGVTQPQREKQKLTNLPHCSTNLYFLLTPEFASGRKGILTPMMPACHLQIPSVKLWVNTLTWAHNACKWIQPVQSNNLLNFHLVKPVTN